MIIELLLLLIPLYYLFTFLFQKRKNIEGQTALITGAGSGIGRLLALRLAKKHCTLVLWDINAEGIQSVARECKDLGAKKVITHVVDITKREKVKEMAQKVKDEVGLVEILINNAGIVSGKKLLETKDEMIVKTFEVNTFALFWTTKEFLPAMMEKNRGHIVTLASMAGVLGVSGLADYSGSKFAAFGFNEALRFELKKEKRTGITATTICPYFINTGMFDGVQSRFPLLLPILEPDYAVDKIINAIETKQEVLIMPRFAYLAILLRGMFPTPVFDFVINFLGVSESMETFKGRAQK